MNPKLLTQSSNYLQNSFSIFLCIIKLTWWVQRVLNVLEGFAHRSLWRRTEWNMVSVYLNDTNTWRHINMLVTPKHHGLEWDIDGLHFERSCFRSSNVLFWISQKWTNKEFDLGECSCHAKHIYFFVDVINILTIKCVLIFVCDVLDL